MFYALVHSREGSHFARANDLNLIRVLLLFISSFSIFINMNGKVAWTEVSLSVDGDAQAGLSPQSMDMAVNKRAATCHVDHTYRDYSGVSGAVERKMALNFPAKLHLILSDPECSHVSRDCGFAKDESHCFYVSFCGRCWLWRAKQ